VRMASRRGRQLEWGRGEPRSTVDVAESCEHYRWATKGSWEAEVAMGRWHDELYSGKGWFSQRSSLCLLEINLLIVNWANSLEQPETQMIPLVTASTSFSFCNGFCSILSSSSRRFEPGKSGMGTPSVKK